MTTNKHSNRQKFVFVVSTGGAVMNEVLKCEEVRQSVHSVVFDHDGEAVRKAQSHGMPVHIIAEADVEKFCDLLYVYIEQENIDYVLSYYTSFYSQKIRDKLNDKIINFHPSLLPAFKGMDGFGDTVSYGARFAGNTVEFIDQVMDEGKIIMQTSCPVDDARAVSEIRHEIFIQQCRALIQIVYWLNQDRVSVDGRRVAIKNARFDSNAYSPSLDFAGAQHFAPGNP